MSSTPPIASRLPGEVQLLVRDSDPKANGGKVREMPMSKSLDDPVFGARPLKRAIQQRVENPLSRLILEGKFGPKDTIRADAKKGKIVFEKGSEIVDAEPVAA